MKNAGDIFRRRLFGASRARIEDAVFTPPTSIPPGIIGRQKPNTFPMFNGRFAQRTTARTSVVGTSSQMFNPLSMLIGGFSRPFSSKSSVPSPSPLLTDQKSKSELKIKPEEIDVITLKPGSEEDFQTFKQIITDEKVAFTSSWVDQYFGIKELREYCADYKSQLDSAVKKRPWAIVDRQDLQDYKLGKSATQIALNKFFFDEQNDEKLREAYAKMTTEAESELGYYKFVEKSTGKFLGGGALAPLEKDQESGRVTKVDVALHILEPKKGIGTACLSKLLKSAFEEHQIKEVWGSSVIDHPGTPTLCASQGMIIQNVGGKKYYLITDQMYEVNKESTRLMNQSAKSAADQFFSPLAGSSNGNITKL